MWSNPHVYYIPLCSQGFINYLLSFYHRELDGSHVLESPMLGVYYVSLVEAIEFRIFTVLANRTSVSFIVTMYLVLILYTTYFSYSVSILRAIY